MSFEITEWDEKEDTVNRRAELVERMEGLAESVDGIYVAHDSGSRYDTGSGHGEDPLTALYELPVSIELTQRIEVVLSLQPEIAMVGHLGVHDVSDVQLVGVWDDVRMALDIQSGEPLHRAFEEYGGSLPGDPRRAFSEPGLRYWAAP